MPCLASRHAGSTESWVARRRRNRPEESVNKERSNVVFVCDGFGHPVVHSKGNY